MMNDVKSYMFMKVRMMFDPPTTSFHLDSLKKMAEEIEWRLHVQTDPPIVVVPVEEEEVII
jgi:hypothetical protein